MNQLVGDGLVVRQNITGGSDGRVDTVAHRLSSVQRWPEGALGPPRARLGITVVRPAPQSSGAAASSPSCDQQVLLTPHALHTTRYATRTGATRPHSSITIGFLVWFLSDTFCRLLGRETFLGAVRHTLLLRECTCCSAPSFSTAIS